MSITVPTTSTPTSDAGVRRAHPGDHPGISRVLAAAFLDDPVFNWMVPDRAALATMLEPMFALFATAFARHDEMHVAATSTRTAGTALWAPPGTPAIHPDDEEAFGAGVAAVAGEHMERIGACIELFEAVHPRTPAWYLQFVAVDPDDQGQGLGSRLLRSVLDRADADGTPAYLEATSERNRALYERHGFRVIDEIHLPDGPTVHPMWRQP